MTEQVILGRRFNGPPDSAHGGYACGVVASLMEGPSRVTLRRPPPLERSLAVRRLDGGAVELRDGDMLVAEGTPDPLADMIVPDPVKPADAQSAAHAYPGFQAHKYPTCFGCGPARAEGDGLRIFSGPVPGRRLVASPWTPAPSLLTENDQLRSEFAWAVLDCPNGWATNALGQDVLERGILLGRLAARVIGPVARGERCVVMGWPIAREGRKLYAGSALFSEQGDLRAVARGIWIMAT